MNKALKESFDEMLDECNEMVKIGDLEYPPSRVLREIDPIAYVLGFNDYEDSLARDWVDELNGCDASPFELYSEAYADGSVCGMSIDTDEKLELDDDNLEMVSVYGFSVTYNESMHTWEY